MISEKSRLVCSKTRRDLKVRSQQCIDDPGIERWDQMGMVILWRTSKVHVGLFGDALTQELGSRNRDRPIIAKYPPPELEVAPRYKLLVNTVYTIYTIQTASYCINSTLYACNIYCRGGYRNGLMSFSLQKEWMGDGWVTPALSLLWLLVRAPMSNVQWEGLKCLLIYDLLEFIYVQVHFKIV